MLLLALALTAAIQDGPAPAASPTPGSARDPERITCINQLKTGSRTNFIRICHSEAEWALLRSENRRVVERGQANRGLRDE